MARDRVKSDFRKTRQALQVSPRKCESKRFGSSSALSIVNAGALVSSSPVYRIDTLRPLWKTPIKASYSSRKPGVLLPLVM